MDGTGLCGGVVAVRVGAFEGPLSSVEPQVAAEVAEVRRLTTGQRRVRSDAARGAREG